LATEKAYNGNSELDIHEEKLLGSGTFGVVFEGELFIKSGTNVQVSNNLWFYYKPLAIVI